MPFIRGDADTYDEMVAELGPDVIPGSRPTEDFEYQPAEATFKPKKLGERARLIVDALLAAGATAFRVRYDGGFDEGFAHADAILFDQTKRPIKQVLKQVATTELVEAQRKSLKKEAWAAERFASASDEKVLENALDEFAHEVASILLGDGFGTGEYQLYGALVADLKSGQITDDEHAKRPADME